MWCPSTALPIKCVLINTQKKNFRVVFSSDMKIILIVKLFIWLFWQYDFTALRNECSATLIGGLNGDSIFRVASTCGRCHGCTGRSVGCRHALCSVVSPVNWEFPGFSLGLTISIFNFQCQSKCFVFFSISILVQLFNYSYLLSLMVVFCSSMFHRNSALLSFTSDWEEFATSNPKLSHDLLRSALANSTRTIMTFKYE